MRATASLAEFVERSPRDGACPEHPRWLSRRLGPRCGVPSVDSPVKVWLLLVALALAGCDPIHVIGGEPSGTISCSSDADCPCGNGCEHFFDGGLCALLLTCTSSQECGDGGRSCVKMHRNGQTCDVGQCEGE